MTTTYCTGTPIPGTRTVTRYKERAATCSGCGQIIPLAIGGQMKTHRQEVQA